MKRIFVFGSLILTLMLLICGFPHDSISQENQIDDKLMEAAKKKTITTRNNLITLFADENGDIVYTAGSILTVVNGQLGVGEGDTAVNVGRRDANVAGTILKSGEYGIVKNGKLEKASGKIGDKNYIGPLMFLLLIGAIIAVAIIWDKVKKRRAAMTISASHVSKTPPTKTEQPSEASDAAYVPTAEDVILKWLDDNPLEIGALPEFRKGQQDFNTWGSGVLVGSREWIAEKLDATLEALNGGQPSFEKTVDYGWQTSKLEKFTVRIQVFLDNGLLAGYYIGRVGEDRYALFGYGIDKDEEQAIPARGSANLVDIPTGVGKGKAPSPAPNKMVTPEYPEWMSAIPSSARQIKIEGDREILAFGTFKCPICGESFGNLPLASSNVICQFNYGMKGIAGGAPQGFANFWWTKIEHCGRRYLVGNKGTH